MKNKCRIPLTSVLIFVFVFSSCSYFLPDPDQIRTTEERRSARIRCISGYTAGAAGAGALVGWLIQGGGKGAAIGAAAGGALGFALAWGHCLKYYSTLHSETVAGYDESARKIGYEPSQGHVVRIEDFFLNPSGATAGGTVDFKGKYYVMAPPQSKDLQVTETRVLEFYDPEKRKFVSLGDVDRVITVAPGLRSADGQFDIYEKAPAGKYKIKFIVSSHGKQDQIARELTVKQHSSRGPAIYESTQIASGG